MNDLPNRLRRLSQRGPHRNPEEVIESAMGRAGQAQGGEPAPHEAPLLPIEPGPNGRLSPPRWLAAAAAAMVMLLVGVGSFMLTRANIGRDETRLGTAAINAPTSFPPQTASPETTVPAPTTERPTPSTVPPTTTSVDPTVPPDHIPPGGSTALEEWIGTYTWTEYAPPGPGSGQTLVHTLALTGVAENGVVLKGRLTEEGFQTAIDVNVEASPADQFLIINVVGDKTGTSPYSQDALVLRLSGDPTKPATTLDDLVTLQPDLPKTGTYFNR